VQSVRFVATNSHAGVFVQNLVWSFRSDDSQFDAVAVRIGQVDGFVHAMVRGALDRGVRRGETLRHTYATLLLSRGTHPTYVQKSLGHASVQLTLDRYSHWMPSMGRNTASAMDEALG
jgi:integrase